MSITIDYSRMVPAVDPEKVRSYAGKIAAIDETLKNKRAAGNLPFYDLPYRNTADIAGYAAEIRGRFKNLVVLGIGGSALGLIALNSSLRSPYRDAVLDPELYVLDNIDPERLYRVMQKLDPVETLVNVITKSGSTAETMASFLVFRKWLIDGVGENGYRDRLVVTTARDSGSLRQIADKEGLVSFEVPEGVGGRFSVLTPVGLLPAALIGIDIKALLSGAAAMDKRLLNSTLLKNPAYLGAVMHYLAYLSGRCISVMFAYGDRLLDLADWYRQLWAESLGKRYDLNGIAVNVGPTPVKALGVTDQHSQVQLYKEGPDDKVYTFLKAENFENTIEIPCAFEGNEAVSYLGGHTINELFNVEERATEVALVKEKRPLTAISFSKVTPDEVGEFFYFFEVQTVAIGALFGIDPLDQPGVEEGKHFAYGLLGRSGFEDKKKEFASFTAGDKALIF